MNIKQLLLLIFFVLIIVVLSDVLVVVVLDGRVFLMEFIRKVGGKGNVKLRSVKERKMKKKVEKEQFAVSFGGGGDFMGDLFVKLFMRRKGIFGLKGDFGGFLEVVIGGGFVMDKISVMIFVFLKVDRIDFMYLGVSDDWDLQSFQNDFFYLFVLEGNIK